MTSTAQASRMRFHVDGWDPTYGSSVENAENGISDSTAAVNPHIELAPADWKPISPSQVSTPGAVLFVDGVRRVEARIWIEQPPSAEPAAHPSNTARHALMALCASYAAGTVCCCPDHGAHLLTIDYRRGLFTTATNALDVPTAAGTYKAHITPDDQDQNLAVLLSTALQGQLADLEVLVATHARTALTGHGVPEGSDLLVVDGPLRGRTHLPRALGFIKSHRTAYLPPDLHAMISTLAPSERSPVFLMGTSWVRHAWYLRLPCTPGAPWAGVVRLECAADITIPDAIELANLSQVVLPRYASIEYKDTRAPQNLVPVAGLERELRRHLGNPVLLSRALRVASAG
ncbi:hypothetical protein [Streptomyces sp. NBC_00151]|uniref:hypothetical protein n=1 Tax=Streptomyces sp. NBC_00151 TaxID=2975669 RepID=UPI002DDB4689|nr:hypothetical protein [Streptomyces sp. NBC_00151]WRZ36636.1 hypothetical protein OG915_00035 [Streptomyces sp. NBC_00151]WRZ44937.1 hypothetical protein OG915_47500 [Streptomyces sp. NBC_00151]